MKRARIIFNFAELNIYFCLGKSGAVTSLLVSFHSLHILFVVLVGLGISLFVPIFELREVTPTPFGEHFLHCRRILPGAVP